jgi:hypothetical protein
MAASTIVSTVATTWAVGKLLNDYIGMEEFIFDPSDKNFGNITLPGGTVINPFSQEQINKAFARSVRILAQDQSLDAGKGIAEEWGKLMISSASPGVRPLLAQIGVGFDPDSGYKWGDLGDGKSFGRRALDAAPIPPIAGSIIREGVDAVRTPLEALGFNSYAESDYDALDRKVKADYGKGYSDLSPTEKRAAQEKYGKLEPFGPEGERAAAVLQEKIREQTASDTRLSSGDLTPERWAGQYKDRKQELAITNEEIYHKLDLETKDPILKGYYDAIDKAKGPDGAINWNAVDKYRASLDPKDSDYITKNTGLVKIDTPAVRKYEEARDKIEASGYFERTDENFATIKNILGLPHESYEEWKAAERKRLLGILGDSATQAYAEAEVQAAIEKSEIGKAMTDLGKQWKEAWVIENPDAAYLAWLYGDYTPTKEVKEYLNRRYAGREP